MSGSYRQWQKRLGRENAAHKAASRTSKPMSKNLIIAGYRASGWNDGVSGISAKLTICAGITGIPGTKNCVSPEEANQAYREGFQEGFATYHP